jgi:uncharacterized membrane protein YhiD involved in acid resistance
LLERAMMMRSTAIAAALLIALLARAYAQEPLAQDLAQSEPSRVAQLAQLTLAVVRLPLAAALASVLALRPRRRGTPRRQPHVIQTQIILALVGALVMLVVGSSLARAFGIVGAAGLVRYRAKIADPKDAGVMLSTLGIGLASGVGAWMLAAFATAFILAVLWVVESFGPRVKQLFALTVTAKQVAPIKPGLEALLARHRLDFELRTTSNQEVCYQVNVPLEKKTDRLSNAILKLAPDNVVSVDWKPTSEDSHL